MAPLSYMLLAFLTLIDIPSLPSTLQVGALANKFSKPPCNTTCGNLTIPYPFGTSKGCYLEDKYDLFLITCRDSVPYLAKTYIKVKNYITGCVSACQDVESVVNGSCSGVGCCQVPVPYGLDGNPYLTSGCIDGCAKSNQCNSPAKCQNQHRGRVLCVCPHGYQRDGKNGCYKVNHAAGSSPIGPGIAIDFGASKIVPRDHAEIATMVQGTFGYIDPEYMYSSELTEKSDVYSFGVILAEILTGERAVSFNRPEKDRNLAVYFISSMKLGNGMPNIIHKTFVEDEKNIEQIKHVVMLAARCLKVTGNERPTMRELAMELERLKTTVEPPRADNTSTSDINEIRYLQTQSVSPNAVGNTNIGSSTKAEFED